MKRILLIEDNEISRIALSKTIEKEGYDVEIAEDGLQGLELFERNQFDIVITDLIMPKLNGDELLRKVRGFEDKNKSRPIPVIILSGHPEADRIEDTNVYFINKPIDIEHLLEKMSALLCK